MLDLERGHFVQGSLKQGYSEEEADLVYDMIVKFANYGFPRAHAAAYGVLAFQTAYLKAHYPVHFMASMLTAVMGSHRKVAEYVVECRRMDMEVLPPDVNESGILFTPVFVPSGSAGTGDQSKVSQQNAGADAESDAGSLAEEHATNSNGSSLREDHVHGHSGQAEYGEAPLPDDPGPEPEEDSGGYEWQAATSMPEASDNRKEPGLVTASSMENGNDEGQEASSSRAEHGELSSVEKNVAVSNDNPAEEKLTGAIRFGLAAVKNVGTQAMESIMIVRQERPFDSLLDFCRRVDLRVCNKRVIESLIQAGAFDTLPGHRAQLLAMLDETVEAALKWRKEREDLQIQLFDFVETPNWEIEYPEIPPYSSGQQLELERELLGLYLSGHPLDDYEDVLESSGADRIMELTEAADDTMTVAAGMVVSVKSITTKQGKAMAFMELEDQIERCEVVLFPRYGGVASNMSGKVNCSSCVPKYSSRTKGLSCWLRKWCRCHRRHWSSSCAAVTGAASPAAAALRARRRRLRRGGQRAQEPKRSAAAQAGMLPVRVAAGAKARQRRAAMRRVRAQPRRRLPGLAVPLRRLAARRRAANRGPWSSGCS